MQAIAAAAGRWVVDREMQVVAAEEPLEGAASFLVPAFFSGDPLSLQAGRDHRLRLHRLLIEAGPFAALRIKTVGANGDKVPASCIRALQVCQPAERLQSRLGHGRIGYGLAAQ